MIPWLWIRANGGARFWDGKSGEGTGLEAGYIQSSLEGTDVWETASRKEWQPRHGHPSLGPRRDCRAWGRNESQD